MNTAHIYSHVCGSVVDQAKAKKNFAEKTFVIGVKGQSIYSLESLLQTYPNLTVIKKFPETVNPNYIHTSPDKHMLQPAWVIWEEKETKK